MAKETIKQVFIWSGWVRLTHWLMVIGVSFQLISAIILQQTLPFNPEFWRDWHLICGQLLLVVVAGRIILLFMLTDSSSWRALLPDKASNQGWKQTAWFYLSLGRSALPNWFAHNPFWRPVYPFMWLLLILNGFSGLSYASATPILGQYLYQWHISLANLLILLVVLHSLAAVVHDLKGRGATISGMISGYRYFHINKPDPSVGVGQVSPFQGSTPPVYISIDSIKKSPPKSTDQNS